MSWPDSIQRLVKQPNSWAARVLRYGLKGLRANIQAALDEDPSQDDHEELERIVSELDRLQTEPELGSELPPSQNGDDSPEPDEPEPDEEAPALSAFAEVFESDAQVREMLGKDRLDTEDDARIWTGSQLLLLRLAETSARSWQTRSLGFAEKAGYRPASSANVELPWCEERVLIPGLEGSPEIGGVRLSPNAEWDERVRRVDRGNDHHTWGEAVSLLLWFVEHDPHLNHCLEDVFRFGIVRLREEARERFSTELVQRWQRVDESRGAGLTSRAAAKKYLLACIELDEAFRSAVYQPTVESNSWWGGWQRRLRELLWQAGDRARKAGCQVRLRELGGSFASINRLVSRHSLQVDTGTPGEVSVCLRVWASVDGEELPGRVLYRAL